MFRRRKKIRTKVLGRIPGGTLMQNLVLIGPAVSEEKNFERIVEEPPMAQNVK